MVSTEKKSPNPGSPSQAGRHRSLYNGPAGGWRAGRKQERAGYSEGIFLTMPEIGPEGNRTETCRWYLEALTITLEALSPCRTNFTNL
jgi:hypothetical protein